MSHASWVFGTKEASIVTIAGAGTAASLLCAQGFYDVALRKEAERRVEAEDEYQVCTKAAFLLYWPAC